MLEAIFGYKSSWRIMELLSETPIKSIFRTEIKQHTKLGNEAVNTAIKRLVASEIVIKEKDRKKESYYLNLSNEFAKTIVDLIKKERMHLKNISFDNITLLNEFIRRLLEKTNFIHKIYLFGSVAKGTARVDSDIDMCLITKKKDIKQELVVTQIIDSLQKQFKREIQAHYFTADEFESSKTAVIKEIKNDGIDLLAYQKRLAYRE